MGQWLPSLCSKALYHPVRFFPDPFFTYSGKSVSSHCTPSQMCMGSPQTQWPEHSPCRAEGSLWACQEGKDSRKQKPVKYMFSLHAWCTVGPQAWRQRGLVGGAAPASIPPSYPSTSILHKTPSFSIPRSPLLPSKYFCDPRQLTSS